MQGGTRILKVSTKVKLMSMLSKFTPIYWNQMEKQLNFIMHKTSHSGILNSGQTSCQISWKWKKGTDKCDPLSSYMSSKFCCYPSRPWYHLETLPASLLIWRVVKLKCWKHARLLAARHWHNHLTACLQKKMEINMMV